ncbi:BTB/POZ domain-containing protein [Tripterygium wilfordii]|uniref:BTB/POZ domain-containing protein n=1 Tax=Tripterygium wilfordii TaxID=458696 RepID=A0A7J7C0S9_TRIWF|nr:BTB/POZ domain-containing protein At2g13690-like [Tripterygium wilfordii]KAF5727712.1 BTB/POZ domain-containing protein [Tripterygium wilfordii]
MAACARRKPILRRRSWCCSLAEPPSSPEQTTSSKSLHYKPNSLSKHGRPNSVPTSPQSCKSGLNFVGRIDRRRILSPGRVSPIDSDPTVDSVQEMTRDPLPAVASAPKSRSHSFRAPPEGSSSSSVSGSGSRRDFDVRLKLKGRNGGSLILELNSEILKANSEVFAALIAEHQKGSGMCRIEVPEVENLGVLRDAIELMFEDDIPKMLMKMRVYRTIGVLEVSAGIMFKKGILACLKYLEAVPWTEEEEENLRILLTKFKFDDVATRDILARLCLLESKDSEQNLARQLVWSITSCADANARTELKPLVKGLLCKSSVYEKDQPDLNKEDIYGVCQSCLGSLVSLFEEASDSIYDGRGAKKKTDKPLIERISRQVDNLNWLLEILIDWQMAEELVNMWTDQAELLNMHDTASPMLRYELSRVSANIFIAIGTRKLHSRSEARSRLLQAWFGRMLSDFGWLQRCKKGLDMKALEEAMGQTLLTLPLKQQHTLFMEWFGCFSKHGTECPNLSKAFQIWWRRSFVTGSESYAIESR